MAIPSSNIEQPRLWRLILAKALGSVGALLVMTAGVIGAYISKTYENGIPAFVILALAALVSGALLAQGQRIVLNRWITYPRTWMLATPLVFFLAFFLYDRLTLQFIAAQETRMHDLVLSSPVTAGLLRAGALHGAGVGLAGGLLIGFIQSRLLQTGRVRWILATALLYLLAGAVIAYALTQMNIIFAQILSSIPPG